MTDLPLYNIPHQRNVNVPFQYRQRRILFEETTHGIFGGAHRFQPVGDSTNNSIEQLGAYSNRWR
jgi:hypothetical protein